MDVLNRPAEEFDNHPTIEAMWAIKAFEHAEVYFNILLSVDSRYLRLTSLDNAIYKHFREEFPNFNIRILVDSELKSQRSKENWRTFCEHYKDCVEEYNHGTLIRIDALDSYTEKNSIVMTKIQFLAIEIARNRENINNELRRSYKPTEQGRNGR